MEINYLKGTVISSDGTVIGYRQMGEGPGVILVHGGMEASQHFTRLAAALADSFTVYIPDRRGRGLSGPFGEDYSVTKDCEDITAVVRKTGAHHIFGLSSGALIALRAALIVPELKRVALYEPPLSINGSSPTQWVARYDQEVAAGQLAQALVTILKGIPINPRMAKVPRFLLIPLIQLGMKTDEARGDDVPIHELVPTQHYDIVIVRETADSLDDYKELEAQVLLLGGSKSPLFLKVALEALEATLPHVQRIEFTGFDHLSATNEGKPGVVAEKLRAFFAVNSNSTSGE